MAKREMFCQARFHEIIEVGEVWIWILEGEKKARSRDLYVFHSEMRIKALKKTLTS